MATTLLLVGLASDLVFGCGSNVVAFAAVGAVTLGSRVGALVALGVWLESQVLGFTLFAYPHDATTVAWGVAIGVATLVVAIVANALASRGRIVAFAAAFGIALGAFVAHRFVGFAERAVVVTLPLRRG